MAIESAPLSSLRVVVHARSVAAAYAARMLATMGADCLLVEGPEGTPLRHEPPFLDEAGTVSALFAYLATGMGSEVCDLASNDAGDGDDPFPLHEAGYHLGSLQRGDAATAGLGQLWVVRSGCRGVHHQFRLAHVVRLVSPVDGDAQGREPLG